MRIAGLLAGILGLVLACNDARLCQDRGGQLRASEVDARLPPTCVMEAVDAGAPCIDAAGCHAGYCACAPAEGRRIRSGDDVAGACPSFPPAPGEHPRCAVVGGRAQVQPR